MGDQLGDIFTYLENVLSHESNIDDGITNQMAKGSITLDIFHEYLLKKIRVSHEIAYTVRHGQHINTQNNFYSSRVKKLITITKQHNITLIRFARYQVRKQEPIRKA